MPGPEVRSREEIAEFVRNNSETLHHPVGTCRIGEDDRAVVKRLLEGTRRERAVVDASVMPEITSGNTNAPTLMIA